MGRNTQKKSKQTIFHSEEWENIRYFAKLREEMTEGSVNIMCLILFAYKVHPQYPLIVAANRDEEYKRKTAPAHFWEDHPNILAGRDLEKMGTWMGVTKEGRFSALTNYRDFSESTEGKRSRGELVVQALTDSRHPETFIKMLDDRRDLYPGYNLLIGDADRLYYYSNRSRERLSLKPGIYGLSNHLLDTPWPKVEKGKKGLEQALHLPVEKMIPQLFHILSDAEPFPDEKLPDTGIPFELERALSPLYIQMDGYGTRSSTVLLISDREVTFIEKGETTKEFQFAID